MTAAFNLQSLAQLSAERIVNCTAEGMVVALLAWLLLRAIGQRNSGTRFAVWFAALLGIAALPLVGSWAASGGEVVKRSEITMPASWALYIFAAWLLVATLGLLRVAVGFWHLRRLRQKCAPVDVASLDPTLRKTLAEFDSPRSVQLCASGDVRVPTAIGFSKPMVVIPVWTMQELSTPELNAILLHELAHIRRRDDWSNLIQKIVGALFFFHPAVWWIEKKLALEREMACDDLVLAKMESTSPRAYAECLVSLAEKSFLRRGLALAQAAVGRLRHISLRVTRILDVNRPKATRVWRPAPVLVGAVSAVCLLALSHAPATLVSFEKAEASPALSAVAVDSAMNEAPQLNARVVPAKLELGPARALPETAKVVSAARKPRMTSSPKPTSEPGVIPVSLTYDAAANVAPKLHFVTWTEVIQTRQYDASGAVVWDLCVWRVTVVGPVENKLAAGTVAKSI